MPIPLIIWAAAGAAGTAGAYLARRQVRKPLELAVLGQRLVGKTRLINTWRGEWEPPGRTQAPTKVTPVAVSTGKQVLNVDKKFVFRQLVDISGGDESAKSLGTLLTSAAAVLYLLDARTLAREEQRARWQGQADDWARVQLDASRLVRATSARRVVFVVTHSDLDARCDRMSHDDYRDLLARQLADVMATVGDAAKVRLVAGSLVDPPRARALSDSIIEHLL
ncbi:GTPase domain-containing protein [Actinophytocola glycyrrhizae]|uniref:GTPase domain-containing protein n=1 Tax=Actinophytocola glycyrrhizae TaxID=2044873 RepID=A0ABV9S923_9PSEU